jgi:hypothetical protein
VLCLNWIWIKAGKILWKNKIFLFQSAVWTQDLPLLLGGACSYILWFLGCTSSDNKVYDLATVISMAAVDRNLSMVCWRWHISFHSYFVDLCQSLSEWHLLLCECVLVCCLEKVPAWIRALSIREFLASKQITLLEHPPYSPNVAQITFFCSWRWRKYWKEGILMTLMTSRVIWQQLWRPFHKTNSNIVLKGGLGAGISAQLPKGSTSKATSVIFSSEVYSTFTVMSSQTY